MTQPLRMKQKPRSCCAVWALGRRCSRRAGRARARFRAGRARERAAHGRRRSRARVQTFYDQTKTFQANFKQKYIIKFHNLKKLDKGNVIFEKPGKMSWTYDEPNGNRVVSDGQHAQGLRAREPADVRAAGRQIAVPGRALVLDGQGRAHEGFHLPPARPRDDEVRGRLRARGHAQGSRRPPTRRSCSTSTRRRSRCGACSSSTRRATATASTFSIRS